MMTNANASGYTTTHPSSNKPKAPNSLPGTPNAGAAPTSFAPSSAPPPAVAVKEGSMNPGYLEDIKTMLRHRRLADAGKLTGTTPSPEALKNWADTRGRVMKGTAVRGGIAAAGAAGVYGMGRLIANHMNSAPHDTESMGSR